MRAPHLGHRSQPNLRNQGIRCQVVTDPCDKYARVIDPHCWRCHVLPQAGIRDRAWPVNQLVSAQLTGMNLPGDFEQQEYLADTGVGQCSIRLFGTTNVAVLIANTQ